MHWIVVLSLVAGSTLGCSSGGVASAGPGLRVVSLHDVMTELLVAMDAADRLVGVDEPVDVSAEVTAALTRVPRVGDLESILAVRPALVIGLHITAAKDPELVARLRQAGIEVYLADPRTLDDVLSMIRAVGARIGAAAAGDQLASRLQSAATAIAPAPWSSGQPMGTSEQTAPTRVFVYDCCDPPFTAGGSSVLGDLIARAGGVNVFADVAEAWTHVSWEQVVERRPELVVINAYAFAGQGDAADKQRAVRAISALATLPTVVIPLRDSLGGIHSVEGLALLRAAIRSRI